MLYGDGRVPVATVIVYLYAIGKVESMVKRALPAAVFVPDLVAATCLTVLTTVVLAASKTNYTDLTVAGPDGNIGPVLLPPPMGGTTTGGLTIGGLTTGGLTTGGTTTGGTYTAGMGYGFKMYQKFSILY